MRGREVTKEGGGEEGKKRMGGSLLVLTEMQCLPSTIVVSCPSVKLNDRMASTRHWHGLLCPIWEPTQWWPDEIHLRCTHIHTCVHKLCTHILDESHQKEVITYHFLSVFAYSFSCSHSDCTGFHKLKPRVVGHNDES